MHISNFVVVLLLFWCSDTLDCTASAALRRDARCASVYQFGDWPPNNLTVLYRTFTIWWEHSKRKQGHCIIMAQIGLLEDNARIAKLCTTFLHFAGHDVTIYEHAQKCLHALLLNGVNESTSNASVVRTFSACVLPIEVLILDLSLPDIDGVEVVWQLQSQPQTQRLPLILCTAAPASEIARALQIAPQATIVTKPFKLETLITAISTALGPVAQ